MNCGGLYGAREAGERFQGCVSTGRVQCTFGVVLMRCDSLVAQGMAQHLIRMWTRVWSSLSVREPPSCSVQSRGHRECTEQDVQCDVGLLLQQVLKA